MAYEMLSFPTTLFSVTRKSNVWLTKAVSLDVTAHLYQAKSKLQYRDTEKKKNISVLPGSSISKFQLAFAIKFVAFE